MFHDEWLQVDLSRSTARLSGQCASGKVPVGWKTERAAGDASGTCAKYLGAGSRCCTIKQGGTSQIVIRGV